MFKGTLYVQEPLLGAFAEKRQSRFLDRKERGTYKEYRSRHKLYLGLEDQGNSY
jgi:hypothetical protein